MPDRLANMGSALKSRISDAARRQLGNAVLAGLALLFIGVAIIAAIVAIGVLLADRWGLLAACLIIAAVSVLMSILLILAVAQQLKQARRRQRAEIAQWNQTLRAAKAIAPDLLGGKALLIVMALGLLAGLSAAKPSRPDKP